MSDRIEIKAALSISDAGEITGIAWPFGSPDRVGDMIVKGAFNSPERLPILFSHDPGQVIGVWDSITETDKGLEVKGRLLIDDVARAREARALVKEGAVTGLSIGFRTKKAKARVGGGRTINALDLHEISLVPFPSHPGARISTVKAAGAAATEESNMDPEDKTAVAPEVATLEKKMGEIADTVKGFSKITDRLDKIEAKIQRPGTTEVKSGQEAAAIEMKAFNGFIRKGAAPDEVKAALTVADDGVLAPEQFGNEILKALRVLSPIRQYAKVISIGASSVKYPKRTGSTAGVWVDETDDRTESEPTYSQVTITPFELAAFSVVSNALLEDNIYDLQGELITDLAESFAIAEGTAFVKGDGTTQPAGVVPAITNIIHTGVAADFKAVSSSTSPADTILEAFHAIAGQFAANGVWMMNRTVLGTVRKWKDNQGRFLVVDPISAGAPTTLLGRPVVEAVDMDNVAANATPIIFGDFSGYRVIDRVSLQVQRDPFTMANKGQVKFNARRRVGGAVTNPDRFVAIKIAV